MARQVYTRLIDDLDGLDATDTVRFGYAGDEYEVDLCGEHLESFEDFLAPYIEHGRRLPALHCRRRGGPRRIGRSAT